MPGHLLVGELVVDLQDQRRPLLLGQPAHGLPHARARARRSPGVGGAGAPVRQRLRQLPRLAAAARRGSSGRCSPRSGRARSRTSCRRGTGRWPGRPSGRPPAPCRSRLRGCSRSGSRAGRCRAGSAPPGGRRPRARRAGTPRWPRGRPPRSAPAATGPCGGRRAHERRARRPRAAARVTAATLAPPSERVNERPFLLVFRPVSGRKG